ncbi:hypothetical protein D3C81_1234530 [compost metagenome]
MRGAGVRIAREVITAMITIKPLPEVQPVHSHSRLPKAVATKVRRPLIIAWCLSAEVGLTTTSLLNTPSSTELILLLVCTPLASSR